ncbi:helix-turn-helix domain-containing protein [Photobacterium nomapromontoriensis]|uniref:helix-turn-helix domain-containing protein n=1 Tax=Photobacterium nomapromontoriensis TaxID=2910237 RepID=UPI003D099909
MENAKLQIAQRIKEAREWKGISQVAMAKQLEIARQTYLDLESGKTEPRITTLIRIAVITDRPLGWFVFDMLKSTNNPIQLQADLLQLSVFYGQLSEPFRSEFLANHISQLKTCVKYLNTPKA